MLGLLPAVTDRLSAFIGRVRSETGHLQSHDRYAGDTLPRTSLLRAGTAGVQEGQLWGWGMAEGVDGPQGQVGLCKAGPCVPALPRQTYGQTDQCEWAWQRASVGLLDLRGRSCCGPP